MRGILMTTVPERDRDNTVEAVLVGGPSDLPEDVRAQRLSPDQYKIKVPHHGRYEHFELTDGEPVPAAPLVLRWTTRTRVAE
jgi:hypothetical protein